MRCPPIGSPLKSKIISIYFPKRLELSLRFVLAFPKHSKIVFDWTRIFLTLSMSFFPLALVIADMYLRTIFEASVFPLPDSPEIRKVNLLYVVL